MHTLRHRFAGRAYRETRESAGGADAARSFVIATTELNKVVDDDEIHAAMLSSL